MNNDSRVSEVRSCLQCGYIRTYKGDKEDVFICIKSDRVIRFRTSLREIPDWCELPTVDEYLKEYEEDEDEEAST